MLPSIPDLEFFSFYDYAVKFFLYFYNFLNSLKPFRDWNISFFGILFSLVIWSWAFEILLGEEGADEDLNYVDPDDLYD